MRNLHMHSRFSDGKNTVSGEHRTSEGSGKVASDKWDKRNK